MAMLLFHVGDHRFAVECASILRVIPQVLLEKMPNNPPFVAGILLLSGEPIPVIDFCQLIEKRATHPFLNSRIILFNDRKDQTLGLLAEKVEEIVDLQPEQFDKEELYLRELDYLEKGYSDDKGMIHLLNLEKLSHFWKR